MIQTTHRSRARVLHPVDWWRVIVDLCYAGHTHKTIGLSIGVGESTIKHWKSGCVPRHHDGAALLALWSMVMGLAEAEVPRLEHDHLHQRDTRVRK